MCSAMAGGFARNGNPLHTPSHARVPAEPQSGPTNSFGRCKCWVLILADRGWPGVRGVKGIPILEETGGIVAPMQALRDLELWLALDDFGTAHASLSTLRAFPFTDVKIDRSFIQRLLQDDRARG